MGPLKGIRILDLTHAVAGPVCTLFLGDMGAEIVKIEKPGRGDNTRYNNISDRFASEAVTAGGDYFLSINRNKRSMAVDMKSPEGREVLSFTMLTVNADGHGVFGRMHPPGDEKRMPVILRMQDQHAWLHGSPAEALAFIRQGSGSHFDPRVVEAFQKILPEASRVMETFADRPPEASPPPPG